ncbi:SpaH/EbpB family LPXTG-anchored major pilin [Leucobacter coleopterorum]|uniref:SpaH/EbpB family LPXTG-anchored major pilin n=2 Tax=Leucobacter coleopterorum TaxID=2714933 RepID=A0ABX6K1J9_9MICO|nr:SpaH/EbpB family LPXTG-anchored major pilin [Leucobacter coleopterorum]
MMRIGVAVAMGAVLALSSGSLALAAPDPLVNPDPGATGSIVIHKFERSSTTTTLTNDGTELPPSATAGLVAMDGVTFSLKRIDPTTYDLATNEGWTALKSLTATSAATMPSDNATTVTTAGGGLATASNLPLGVYLVTETGYPADAVPAEPFLVTVPITDPSGLNTWLYDVHVYPKNVVTKAGTKTVEDSQKYAVGDTIKWTILGNIPVADPIDGYKIVDPLDTRLDYTSATVSLTNPDTTLTEGGDYTLVVAPSVPALTNDVTIQFTTTGLAKLVAAKTANAAAQVKVIINTKINIAGDIVNTAQIYPNLASFDIQPGQPGGPTPTNPAETKYGNVTLKKHGLDATTKVDKTLEGAEFQVFATEADALAKTNPITVTPKVGAPVDTWTTAADGTVTISGLHNSDWHDGAVVAPGDPNYQYYWLVETKAPAGYELLAKPYKVEVLNTDTVVDYSIENSLANGGFTLPFTGSLVSTSIFYGGGALILLGVVLMVIRSRRKVSVEGS